MHTLATEGFPSVAITGWREMAVWTNGGMDKQLLQAAEKGNADAQYNLGVLYANGLHDDRHSAAGDRPEAIKWLLAAAEQGLPRAQIKLAELYAGQPDAAASRVAACGWFLVAMTSLHGVHLRNAQSGYERASLHLTPTQTAEAAFLAESRKRRPQNDVAVPGTCEIPHDGRTR